MENKNQVKLLYQKLTRQLERNGFININHKVINSREDLAELSAIFRNPRYETFRIIYMNNNSVVGYESITSKLPDRVDIFQKDSKEKSKYNSERCFYKIKD